MKKGAKHKILKILVICMLLVFITNPVFAAINEEYYVKDPSTSEGLSQAVSGSTLLELLAKLVYAVGRLLEWLLGKIFSLLTGNSDFPWADKIVFNAVPLLDVNFMNPHRNSFVFAIQDVIKSTYATVMALAVSFFGIFVLITAIKLVLSTLASEKAKYKQAIVDWFLGLVLLFCMHYGISFIFYLNEELVTVASKIVTNNLAMNKKVMEIQNSKMVDELIARVHLTGQKDIADFLEQHRTLTNTWLNELDTSDDSDGIHEALAKEMDGKTDKGIDSEEKQYQYVKAIFDWALNSKITIKELESIYKNDIGISVGYQKSDGSFADKFWNGWFGDSVRWANNIIPSMNIYGTGEIQGYMYIRNDTYDKIFVDAGKYGPSFDLDFKKAFDKPTAEDVESKLSTNTGWQVKLAKYIAVVAGGSLFSGIASDNINLEDSKDTWKSILDDIWASTGVEYAGQYSATFNANTHSDAKFDNIIPTGYSWVRVIEDLIILKEAAEADKVGENYENTNRNKSRILSDLASYFRFNAYTRTLGVDGSYVGTNDKGNIQIQNMLMYTILVVQSLILFIAYIKRLFYVVIMALIAPVVVVMDFFSKFGK